MVFIKISVQIWNHPQVDRIIEVVKIIKDTLW